MLIKTIIKNINKTEKSKKNETALFINNIIISSM